MQRNTLQIQELLAHVLYDLQHYLSIKSYFFTNTNPFKYSPSGNVTVIG